VKAVPDRNLTRLIVSIMSLHRRHRRVGARMGEQLSKSLALGDFGAVGEGEGGAIVG
jgi:hypothetical protein